MSTDARLKGFGRSFIHLGLPLLGCLGLLVWLRLSGLGVDGQGPQSTTIAIGFLLIGAFVGGQVVAKIGLPRISGYLLVGLVAGPHLTRLITEDMMVASKAIDGIAVALIALTAGGEIKMEWVRKQIRQLLIISAFQLTLVFTLVTLLMFFGRSLFDFMPTDSWMGALVIAIVFGCLAASSSPTVTIAVLAETRSAGPLSRTVLGVTVLADVFIIVLFAIVLAVARDVLGHGGGDPLTLTLLRELGGSVLAGIAVGMGISWFLDRINRDVPVFTLMVCFGISQVALAWGLESLLIALTAGFYVENFAKVDGHRLIAGIERVSLPVFALFFAAAGAKVDLGKLLVYGPLAAGLIAVRAGTIWVGTHFGTKIAKTEPIVHRYAWTGLISQAGVSLALSAIVARAFPTWGVDIQVLIIAMIAVHEMIGPVLFNFGLGKAGERGQATQEGEQPASRPTGSVGIVQDSVAG